MAWAFTRLRLQGVCRYLRNVDEVNCPRFIFVYLQILINNLNNDDDKETATIIRYYVNAIRNNLPFHRDCVKSE